jgi:hypothetical protein
MPADKYAEIFGTKVHPPMNLQGRGLINLGNEVFEFQGFMPFREEESALDHACKEQKGQVTKLVSFEGDLTTDNFQQFANNHQTVEEANGSVSGEASVTVGLDYYDMKPITLDLLKTASIGIYGKRQSGKTNLLWLIIEKAIHQKNAFGVRVVLFDDGRKQLKDMCEYLREQGVDYEYFTQIADLKNYIFDKGYYKSAYDDVELKDNPYTIFVMQNKSLYSTKGTEFLERYGPEMQSESEGKWLFIYSDIKNISESMTRNAFHDSLSLVFLLDNIGDFVSDRGAKTVFGAMDAKELKERFARIERGDGYLYDIESDELMKLKFIHSKEPQRIDRKEVI